MSKMITHSQDAIRILIIFFPLKLTLLQNINDGII